MPEMKSGDYCRTTNWKRMNFFLRTKGARKSKFDMYLGKINSMEKGETIVIGFKTKKEAQGLKAAIIRRDYRFISADVGRLSLDGANSKMKYGVWITKRD